MTTGLADPFISDQGWVQQPQARPSNMHRTSPPHFRLPQSRQDSGNTNELDSLRDRSIELETELRLTKEQLLQAQSGTQYLVNCFANQQDRGVVQGSVQNQLTLEGRNQQLETEVHRLRGQALVQQRSRIASPKTSGDEWNGRSGGAGGRANKPKEEQENEIAMLKEQRASLLNDVLQLLKEDAYDYSFLFDSEDPAAYRPLDHFKNKHAAAASRNVSLLDSDLVDSLASPFDGKAAGKETRVDSPLTSGTPTVKKHRIYVKPGDIALLDLDPAEQLRYELHATRKASNIRDPRHPHQHAPADSSPIPAQLHPEFGHPVAQNPPTAPHYARERGQFGRPQHFADFEHKHLMGNATFIEEKEAEEYLEFWESLEADVRRFAGRHTKEEWKLYYETIVRPAFLQRMATRSAPVVEGGAVEAEKENILPAREAEVPVKTQEINEETVTVEKLIIGDSAGAENVALFTKDHVNGITASTQVAVPNTTGLGASRWAAPNHPTSTIPGDVFQQKVTAGVVAKPVEETSVSLKSRAMDKDSPLTMPAIPAFGSLGLQLPLKTTPLRPIPGLAGGCPQPLLRDTTRSARIVDVHVGERDPSTWEFLFLGVQRKSQKVFVLGQNEKLFRTVAISGIQAGTTLAEVLDQVRGGKIVSAKFLDTAGMKTTPPMTTNTVVVEFLGAQRAKEFFDHCEKHSISLGAGNDSEPDKADVQLIRTQTRSLPPEMLEDMRIQEGALTRVLFLIFADSEKASAPEAIAREITSFATRCKYSDLPKHPLRITIAEDGMLLFEYADVRQAAAAWNVVCALEWKLGEVSKGFAADPCGRAFGSDEKVEDGQEGKKGEANKGDGDALGVVEEFSDDELEAEAKAKLMEG